ncbi:MAG: 3-oxoacyl-ACP synthase III [Pirellulaceae bacterium]
MQYDDVCLEAIGYTLPSEVVTSAQLERRLAPLYERLRLPEGRLELMTGVRERRFWPAGTLPSQPSIESAEKAVLAAGIERRHIGALVHASVCRDHLEPATACRVHHALGLDDRCLIYDVSNACLGLLDGIVQLASFIQLGHIRAGLVVGTEAGRSLVETTIAMLNRDTSLSRDQIKRSLASLTIGSASAAVVLCHRRLSSTHNRLLGATALANTAHHQLCRSGRDEAAAGGMQPLMETDSEALMREGIATGRETFHRLLAELQWTAGDIDKTVCHQVGTTHRRLLLEALQLDPANDFMTVDRLGNTGSVAVPVTMAMGAEQGHLAKNDRVALMGIGSGINCLILAVDWQQTPPAQAAASPVSCKTDPAGDP